MHFYEEEKFFKPNMANKTSEVVAKARVILSFRLESFERAKHWTFISGIPARFRAAANMLAEWNNNRSGRICSSRPELDIIPRKRPGKLYLSWRIGRVHTGGQFDCDLWPRGDQTERSLNALSLVFLNCPRVSVKSAGDIHSTTWTK